MIGLDKHRPILVKLRMPIVVVAVLAASVALGFVANTYVLVALVGLFGLVALLLKPQLGLPVLVAVALLARFDIPTGTEVLLNPATLLVPALAGLTLVSVLLRRSLPFAQSRMMLPMAVFLVMSLVSLFVGNATWDPFVPRGNSIIVVQLAQWSIYAFSFMAFWLAASLGQDVRWLKWMTAAFLGIGGLLALILSLPPTRSLAYSLGTVAIIRAPFWTLLAGLAGGQFLFNSKLTTWQRVAAGVVVALAVVYSFAIGQESASFWVGVGSALAVLTWLRFRRLRWVALVFILILLFTGLVFPTLWSFAGGEEEWTTSGQSRLVLIERVLSVSLRNPVTGLGPVAYRSYASTTPLAYERAFWLQPEINSHNNYVDIFAQFGLVGLAIIGWLAAEIGRAGLQLHSRLGDGFEAGYVRGVMASGAGALSIMMLADWILPFVYNIGFPGFQASVLFWLFLGGLAALWARTEAKDSEVGEAAGS